MLDVNKRKTKKEKRIYYKIIFNERLMYLSFYINIIYYGPLIIIVICFKTI